MVPFLQIDSGLPGDRQDFATDVYAIPVADRWLVYGPLAKTAAIVNETGVGCLVEARTNSRTAESLELRELAEALVDRSGHPGDLPAHTPCPSKLVILPSRQCNMQCTYCDFSADRAIRLMLDPAMGCRAADYVARCLERAGESVLHVHFFGGEPLVARSAVDVIVHYVRALCARRGMTPRLEVTTNGKVDPAYALFVGDYFDSVVLSFDGLPEFQDHNRRNLDGSGTFDEVAEAIRRLSRCSAELCLRVCITDRSVGRMGDILSFICENFDVDVVNFETLAANERSEAAGLVPPDPYEFAKGFLKARQAAQEYGVRVVNGPTELARCRYSSCPVGTDAIMVMPDGMVTACYLPQERWLEQGLDFSLGLVSPEQGIQIDVSKLLGLREHVRRKPRCERCFCRWSCAGGCHVAQTPAGCSPRLGGSCVQTRLITAGLLLSQLHCDALLQTLLEDAESTARLALHDDDRLAAWRLVG